MRYRLRFLLQEFDLPNGATVIGRSLDCNLTIEDPLVSRQHARIVVDDGGGRVEDMGSRNGVRVNGTVIREPTVLRDGDRVRIGTQDLVFCSVGFAGQGHAKTTGVLRLCANCRLPYPREMLSCPHCEATEQTDEGTLTGEEEHGLAWTVQLLAEALSRALAVGRVQDAERIVRRAIARLDEYLGAGGAIDAHMLTAVATRVIAMTLATGDPAWVLWVLELHRRVAAVPSLEVADRLVEASEKCSEVVGGPLGVLLEHLRSAIPTASAEEVESMTRLNRAWRRAVAAGHAPGRSTSSGDWPVQ